MINTHLRNIVESADIMRELSNKSLKGRAAFRVARLLRELEKEFTLFNEKRMDLIKEYAQKDENGEMKSDENGNVTLDQDRLNEFYQSLDELLRWIILPLTMDTFTGLIICSILTRKMLKRLILKTLTIMKLLLLRLLIQKHFLMSK